MASPPPAQPSSLATLNPAMIRRPLTLSANTPLSEAIAQMERTQASCILIAEQQKLIGSFTERDLVKWIASGQTTVDVPLSSAMNPEAIALKASEAQDLPTALNFMRQHRLRHLPIVDDSHCPVGLLEWDNLIETLTSDSPHLPDQSAPQLQEKPAKIPGSAERERLLATIALRIRQSLNLEEILNTAVAEVRQLLQTDRVLIYRFLPDWSGEVAVESVSNSQWSILGKDLKNSCFDSVWLEPYKEGRARAISDIYTEKLSPCHVEFLSQFQVIGNLIVPILQRQESNFNPQEISENNGSEQMSSSAEIQTINQPENPVWGLLCAHHCTGPRSWQPEEIDLIEKLANSVALAIQQATLIEQLQTELAARQQAEKALQKSEETLRMALEAANLWTWDWDILNNQITWSNGYEKLFGLASSSFDSTYQTFEICVHPDDRKSIATAIDRALEERQDYHHEFRIIWPDGTLRWIEGKGTYLYDVEGQAVRMLGTVLDISDRKQAEFSLKQAKDELEIRIAERTAQLSETNRLLQGELFERKQAEAERAKLISILEATSDLIATATGDQHICYLNRAARNFFGIEEHDKLENFSIRDAHPDWAYEIIKNQGIPTAIRDGVWVGETAFLSGGGREILMSQLIVAHFSSDGRVKLLSTIARDIRQQKEIEATVREAERRWRSLLENVRLVVVGFDTQGNVEYVNPFFLELVGYTKTEILGKNWVDFFVPPSEKNRVQSDFFNLAEELFPPYYQNPILAKSGEERIIAWNNTLLRNPQGEVIGTMSIGEDITQRQAIERMKDEFVSVVSHELRTPLTSIYGGLNLIASGLIDANSDKGKRVIAIAAESADRLVRLVNDILDLERLQSGKISLVPQVIDGADAIARAAEQMQEMANRAGITLALFPQKIQLKADGDRLLQVLTNLLSNAIKFSPRGSTVWLSVEQMAVGDSRWGGSDRQSILFTVKDQGRGIPADKIETIFERFQQVDASDSRKKGGTGLGLAICRSIVEQQGGQIWVESILNRGSSFYFTLPAMKVEAEIEWQPNEF